MSVDTVVALAQQALWVAALVGGPLLLAALGTGVLVSVLQAATQMNEMTLSFIPKLVVMMVVLVVAGPWMLTVLVDFARVLFENLPAMIG